MSKNDANITHPLIQRVEPTLQLLVVVLLLLLLLRLRGGLVLEIVEGSTGACACRVCADTEEGEVHVGGVL